MDWWMGCPVQRSDSSSNPRVWGLGRRPKKPAIPYETGCQVRSDQWVGRQKISRKDFHRFVRQYRLHDSGLQVSQTWNGQ